MTESETYFNILGISKAYHRHSKVGHITFPHSRKHEIHFFRLTVFLLAFALDVSFNCKGVLFVTLRLNAGEY